MSTTSTSPKTHKRSNPLRRLRLFPIAAAKKLIHKLASVRLFRLRRPSVASRGDACDTYGVTEQDRKQRMGKKDGASLRETVIPEDNVIVNGVAPICVEQASGARSEFSFNSNEVMASAESVGNMDHILDEGDNFTAVTEKKPCAQATSSTPVEQKPQVEYQETDKEKNSFICGRVDTEMPNSDVEGEDIQASNAKNEARASCEPDSEPEKDIPSAELEAILHNSSRQSGDTISTNSSSAGSGPENDNSSACDSIVTPVGPETSQDNSEDGPLDPCESLHVVGDPAGERSNCISRENEDNAEMEGKEANERLQQQVAKNKKLRDIKVMRYAAMEARKEPNCKEECAQDNLASTESTAFPADSAAVISKDTSAVAEQAYSDQVSQDGKDDSTEFIRDNDQKTLSEWKITKDGSNKKLSISEKEKRERLDRLRKRVAQRREARLRRAMHIAKKKEAMKSYESDSVTNSCENDISETNPSSEPTSTENKKAIKNDIDYPSNSPDENEMITTDGPVEACKDHQSIAEKERGELREHLRKLVAQRKEAHLLKAMQRTARELPTDANAEREDHASGSESAEIGEKRDMENVPTKDAGSASDHTDESQSYVCRRWAHREAEEARERRRINQRERLMHLMNMAMAKPW